MFPFVYSNYVEPLCLQNWSRTKFCKIFSPFHVLVFAKCCKKIFFPFIFVAMLSVTERAKAAWKHKLIEENYVNYFQPCQESLELKVRASSVIGFDDSFCPSVCFLALLLTPPYCFLHLQLCEHWHLKEREFFFKLHQLICKCETSAFISSFFF